MQKIGQYFKHDYVSAPDPGLLQECILFNVLYFFCCHGKENLHPMTKQHFAVAIKYDGSQYVHQVIDELDKNHWESTTELANQAKMYSNPGKI